MKTTKTILPGAMVNMLTLRQAKSLRPLWSIAYTRPSRSRAMAMICISSVWAFRAAKAAGKTAMHSSHMLSGNGLPYLFVQVLLG